jgi:hypothetical protein
MIWFIVEISGLRPWKCDFFLVLPKSIVNLVNLQIMFIFTNDNENCGNDIITIRSVGTLGNSHDVVILLYLYVAHISWHGI